MRRTTHHLYLGLAILCLAIPISSFAGNIFVFQVTVTEPDGTPINGTPNHSDEPDEKSDRDRDDRR